MIKLTAVMAEALRFYSEDHTHEAVAYPKTGTRVALIRRGLLTPAYRAWEHELTADGWAFLCSGQTMAEAHEMAIELNIDITRAVRAGRDSLDRNDRRYTNNELNEKIADRAARLESAVDAVSPAVRLSHKDNVFASGMVRAHAFWLGVYRAERDRRSRMEVANTYAIAVHNGLAQRGMLAATPLAAIHQAIQDLLHGEACEEYRPERDRRSREAAVHAAEYGVVTTLKSTGRYVATSPAEVRQAVQDLLHGKACKEHQARGFVDPRDQVGVCRRPAQGLAAHGLGGLA